MPHQKRHLAAIVRRCVSTTVIFILYCCALGCESDFGSRSEVQPWPTEEAVAIRPDLGAPFDATNVLDSGPSPPLELDWPELKQTYVLHGVEESVPFDAPSLPDYFVYMDRYGFPFGFRIIGDWSEDRRLEPAYRRLGRLRSDQPVYYIGLNLVEADGKRHLYQCDFHSEERVYIRPEGYVGCTQPGSLSWRFHSVPNDVALEVPKCANRRINAPPLPEPWLERYLQMAEGGMEEPSTGIPIRLLAYFPEADIRSMTEETEFSIVFGQYCLRQGFGPLIREPHIDIYEGSP